MCSCWRKNTWLLSRHLVLLVGILLSFFTEAVAGNLIVPTDVDVDGEITSSINYSISAPPVTQPSDYIIYVGDDCTVSMPNLSTVLGTPVTQSIAAGTLLRKGRYFIKLTSLAQSNQVSYITVSVVDGSPPIFSGIADIVTDSDAGDCGAPVNYSFTVTDNCSNPDGAVLSSYLYVGTKNGRKFYKSNFKTDWCDANNRAFRMGASLATVRDNDERLFLLSQGACWVGLNELDNVGTGEFTWINGDTATYRFWNPGSPVLNSLPSGVVINVLPNYWWYDYDANSSYYFLIEIPVVTEEPIELIHVSGPESGEWFDAGITTVSYQAKDISGNVAEQSFTVTVNDITPPEITCVDSLSAVVSAGDCTAAINVPTPYCTDNCGDYSINWKVSGATTIFFPDSLLNLSVVAFPVTFNRGVSVIEFRATDQWGNSSGCMTQVVVTDDTPPAILNYPSELTLSLSSSCNAQVPDLVSQVTVTDNCSGTLSISQNPVVGEVITSNTQVEIIATDSSGNSSTCHVSLVLADVTAPTISGLPTTYTLEPQSGCGAALPNFAPMGYYHDNCSNLLVINQYPPTATIIYTDTDVVLEVVDLSGNSSQQIIHVELNDSTEPSILCPDDIVAQLGAASCSVWVTIPNLQYTDNCTIATVRWEMSGATVASSPMNGINILQGFFFNLGVTSVIYTVIDIAGNTIQCSFSVTVEDNIAPTITCPSSIEESAGEESCSELINLPSPEFSDNCSVSSLTWAVSGATDYAPSINTGIQTLNAYHFNTGISTITYTVFDTFGNSAQCSSTISIVDDISPEIDCPSNITAVTGLGNCMKELNVPAPSFSDNCGISELSWEMTGAMILSSAPGGVNTLGTFEFPVGTTAITYTIVDYYGNTNQCDFTVKLTDNQLPEVACPSDHIAVSSPGDCGRNLVITTPEATDNCGIQVVTNNSMYGASSTDASGFYPVGTYTFSWNVLDFNGNSVSCNQTISISDIEAPVIDCTPLYQVSTDANSCDAFVNINTPQTSDNCSVSSVVNNSPYASSPEDASGVYPKGTTTFSWTVTDIHNNTSTCVVTVIVEDTTGPTITCPSDIVVSTVPASSIVSVEFGLPEVSDNCSGVSTFWNDYTDSDESMADFFVGNSEITWFAEDADGNVSQCSFTVSVVEGDSPQINCEPELFYYTSYEECGVTVDLEVPSATDADGIDGSVINDYSAETDGIHFSVGTYMIVWSAQDVLGNIGQCTTAVIVQDTIAPIVNCEEEIIGTTSPGQSYGYLNISAPLVSEACAYIVENNWSILDETPHSFEIGTTSILWTATDESGNVGQCSTQVIIIDNTAPALICAEALEVPTELGECGAWVEIETPTIEDNEPNVTIVNSLTGAENPSGYFAKGEYEIIWTATDINGNDTSCVQILSVLDMEAPHIFCEAQITVYTEGNGCGVQVFMPSPSATDNCDTELVIINTQNDASYFDYYLPVGDTTFTWIAIDQSGNSGHCAFTITVVDTSEYYIDCPENELIMVYPNQTFYVNDYISSLPDFDECGLAVSHTQVPEPGTLLEESTTVFITTIDEHGTSTVCSFDIILTDYELPIIEECPSDTIEIYFDESCTAYFADFTYLLENQLDYNGVYIIHQSPAAGQEYNNEEHVELWVEDAYGYTTESCSLAVFALDTIPPHIQPVNADNYVITCNPDYFYDPIINDCNTQQSIVPPAPPEALQPGINHITVTASDGYNTSYYTYTVELVEVPEIVWEGVPDSICVNESPFELSVETEADYHFEIDGIYCPTKLFNPEELGVGIHSIRLIASYLSCGSDLYKDVVVLPIPQLNFTEQDYKTCDGLINLEVVSDAELLEWTIPDGVSLSSNSEPVVDAITELYGVFEITVIGTLDGCTSSASTNLNFLEQPSKPNAGEDRNIFLTNSVILNGEYNGHGQVSWEVVEGSGSFSDVNDISTEVSGVSMGLNSYALWVNNDICNSSDTVNVMVNGLFVPTGFSPNDDGVNDYFEIKGIENLDKAELRIFNRWGQTVYHAEKYMNEWNGLNDKRIQLPDDTYFYELILDNENLSGYVVVKR